VATGWEGQLTIAVDAIVDFQTMMELSAAFSALNPPTRLKLRNETLSGTLIALTSGQADLAVGVSDQIQQQRRFAFRFAWRRGLCVCRRASTPFGQDRPNP
jgi:DNA-binding transcriptional LysR family regulator